MSSEVRVLIIDDESAIRNTIRLSFLKEGYLLAEASNAAEGINKTKQFHPHLILLDLGLPDANGFEVLKDLRKWSQVPVIILTVTDDELTKVKLLDSGANDFLTKPFGTLELLARARVALRSGSNLEATPVFKSGNLEIDLSLRQVKVSKKIIKLSSTEFEVLAKLARDPGKVISQLSLLKQIWGTQNQDQTHYLRIYVNQIRKKIEEKPSEPQHLLTEPGVGYRLV